MDDWFSRLRQLIETICLGAFGGVAGMAARRLISPTHQRGIRADIVGALAGILGATLARGAGAGMDWTLAAAMVAGYLGRGVFSLAQHVVERQVGAGTASGDEDRRLADELVRRALHGPDDHDPGDGRR